MCCPGDCGPTTELSSSGRDEELAWVSTLWRAVGDGARRAVLIGGEPGVGKTSLATEVARSLFEQGAGVLYGRCDEDLGAAYQPFAEALGEYVATCSFSELRSHVERFGPDLVRIVPQLARRLPSTPASQIDPDAETSEALRGGSGSSPTHLTASAGQWCSMTCTGDEADTHALRHIWNTGADVALGDRHVSRL